MPRVRRARVTIIAFAAIVLPLLLAQAGPARAAKRLAVLEFQGDGSIGESELLTLADKVRGEALNALGGKGWSVMTRENMLVLLEANTADLEACIGECEVETGRMIGADCIVAGRAVMFGTRYTVILRAYDTENGELIASQEVTGDDLDTLWDGLGAASYALFGLAPHSPVAVEPRTSPRPGITTERATPARATSANLYPILERSTGASVAASIIYGVAMVPGIIGLIGSIDNDWGFGVAGLGIGMVAVSLPFHIGASVEARSAFRLAYPDSYIPGGLQAGGVVMYAVGISLAIVAIPGGLDGGTSVGVTMGISAVVCSIFGHVFFLADADKYRQMAQGRRPVTENPRRGPRLTGAFVLPTDRGAVAGLSFVLP